MIATGGAWCRSGRGIGAAVAMSGMLVAGCGGRSSVLENGSSERQGRDGDSSGGVAVAAAEDGGTSDESATSRGAAGEDLPAAQDSDGCNTRLAPTIGNASQAAFAANGPWQLCGTYGVGGAYVVKASDDGRRVALLTDSGQVWVLDARSFRLLGVFAHGDGPISLAGLSPDGRILATVDCPVGRVGLWDVESHTLLRVLFRPGAALTYYGLGDVAFSSDGKRVAVVSVGHVDVFDTATGSPLPISGRTDVGGAMRVAFAAGDTRLVLARFRYWGNGPYAGWGSVDLVDVTTGDDLRHLDEDLSIDLPAISLSGDGNTLAVGSTKAGSKPITFFDARTGQKTGEQVSMGVPLGLDHAGVTIAMLEPPPPLDASGTTTSAALTVTVRRTSDGAVLNAVTIDPSLGSAGRQLLAVTPGLDAVLLGQAGTRVFTRLDIASGQPAVVACGAGHVGDIAGLAMSRDGQVLVSTGDSNDATKFQWDVGTGALLGGPPRDDLRQASSVSRDGKLQTERVTDDPTFFNLRDVTRGNVVGRLGPQPTRPTTFDFASDASLIASASERDPADRQRAPVTYIWSVDSGDLQQTLPVLTGQPETSAQPVLFGDDGRHVLVGGFGSTALWCRSP
jgi:WD40 repeat protein